MARRNLGLPGGRVRAPEPSRNFQSVLRTLDEAGDALSEGMNNVRKQRQQTRDDALDSRLMQALEEGEDMGEVLTSFNLDYSKPADSSLGSFFKSFNKNAPYEHKTERESKLWNMYFAQEIRKKGKGKGSGIDWNAPEDEINKQIAEQLGQSVEKEQANSTEKRFFLKNPVWDLSGDIIMIRMGNGEERKATSGDIIRFFLKPRIDPGTSTLNVQERNELKKIIDSGNEEWMNQAAQQILKKQGTK